MNPLVSDPDFDLYVGDVREVLATLPDESVHCVVTSPPYWGLRDYGTGEWEGGDAECDHTPPKREHGVYKNGQGQAYKSSNTNWDAPHKSYGSVCGKCGATRVDRQLGLEPTPEEYVANMVEVFREVRRVLRKDGTCWVNLGDSYATNGLRQTGRNDTDRETPGGRGGSFRGGARTAIGDGTPAPMSSMRAVSAHAESDHNGSVPESWRADCKPKDLVGIPWRVAFALQADGWYLRSDIIWSKPNPMPESVTDRPTKAHEYVFLLTKSPRYFFDQEAVREKAEWARWGDQTNGKHEGSESAAGWIGSKPKAQLQGGRHARRYSAEEFKTTDERNTRYQGPNPADGGRNIRSVWEIPTQPYPEAHFATYPEALVERCLKAGCPEQVCGTCGTTRERITEIVYEATARTPAPNKGHLGAFGERAANMTRDGFVPNRNPVRNGQGFTDCGHNDYRPGVCLDPFLGSGTTALVARRHGRHCIGIELSPEYAALAAKRLSQLSLLA